MRRRRTECSSQIVQSAQNSSRIAMGEATNRQIIIGHLFIVDKVFQGRVAILGDEMSTNRSKEG